MKSRTTIGLRTATKTKLDKNRAPGQCYDGFLCQMVELWEKTHNGISDDHSVRLGDIDQEKQACIE